MEKPTFELVDEYEGERKGKLVGDVEGKFDAGSCWESCWEERRLYNRSSNGLMHAGIPSFPILISHSAIENDTSSIEPAQALHST